MEARSFIPDHARSLSKSTASLIYALILCMSLTILMLALWLAKRCKHNFHPNAPVAKALLFSAMFQSWIWFLYLYGYQFWALTMFKNLLYSRRPIVSVAYMPFVNIGYLTFGIMGGVLLAEIPFLLCYIHTQVMFPNGSKRLLSSACFKSIGCAGMVLFAQVSPSYCLCFFLGILTFPLVPLFLGCILVVLFSLFTACTALVILPCFTGCRRCPQRSCFIVFFILLALSCAGVLLILSWVIDCNNKMLLNTNSITSGLFVSCTFAVLGFTLRSLLYQNGVCRGDYLPISS